MNKDIERFRELLFTDEGFQAKLKTAAEAYTGEQTEEAVFNDLLVPLASEYGITATFDDFKKYLDSIKDQELSADEIAQVAGGGKDAVGFGASGCLYVGVGWGGGGESGSAAGCAVVGFGNSAAACAGDGVTAGGAFSM